MPSQRVEQALERLAEDETLLADLDDAAAHALRGWIECEVRAAENAPDFQDRIGAIRSAARAGARNGDADPVAAARAALAAGRAAARPSRTRPGADAYRAAAAHLLAPAGAETPSPAAALLAPVAEGPQAVPARPEQATPKRTARAKRRRACWRYRKVR